MGRADGGQGGRVLRHPQGREDVAGLQAPFGVGDQVQLFAVLTGQNFLHPAAQKGPVALDAPHGVLAAEVHPRAVGPQGLRDPTPVAQAPVVTAVQAVYQKQRGGGGGGFPPVLPLTPRALDNLYSNNIRAYSLFFLPLPTAVLMNLHNDLHAAFP